MDECPLSQVVAHLTGDEKGRYKEKLKAVGIGDPYLMPPRAFSPLLTAKVDDLPRVSYGDIYNYLITRDSCYTHESLKAFKNLDAYKYFVSGFISDVQITKATAGKYIITAKVSHSQRLNDPPLRPWIACERTGNAIASHCTCKAGLGEVCSHVAAVLFLMEAVVKKKDDTACTSLPCEWIQPSAAKGQPREACKMDFSSIHTKKKRMESGEDSTVTKKKNAVPQMTRDEQKRFFADLSGSGSKCAVLAVIKDHSQTFIPSSASVKLPNPLSSLYFEGAVGETAEELQSRCEDLLLTISVTDEQVGKLEKLTRKQSRSKLWYQHRAGRVTASKFRTALNTSLEKPAKSLVKQICYPNSNKFSTEATRWGCKHEDHARKLYCEVQSKHINFRLQDSGLYIHPKYPHLGATPDGVIECDCCGKGVVEIKCPFCKKGMSLMDAAADAKFCLERNEGVLHLKKTHSYYFQVQGQMLITDRKYCDFVVWTDDAQTLHVERIPFDEHFIDTQRLLLFFKLCILPELVAKRVLNPPVENIQTDQVWCYCRAAGVTDDMVCCSNKDCTIGKFHLSCLGYKRRPRAPWSCVNCKKQRLSKPQVQAKKLKK